ncbi:MAG TPA: hypothetical protein VD789_12505, partial [Thermomicrobiales bacterium]|nr:hypothetical protein [Thermomicrobiales bacterium]
MEHADVPAGQIGQSPDGGCARIRQDGGKEGTRSFPGRRTRWSRDPRTKEEAMLDTALLCVVLGVPSAAALLAI